MLTVTGIPVPDPDLEIKREGGGGGGERRGGGEEGVVQKILVGLKIRGGVGPSPESATASYRVFSHDVTAAILVSQNNETAAMLVSQTNPLGVELFSYANDFFCSNKFA